MSKSIGSNIKTIVKQSINIPLELLSVTVEVTSDVATMTSDAIGGVLPTTRCFLKANRNFALGAVNSELTEKQLNDKIAEISLSSILDGMEERSGKAGQSTTKALAEFFAEE